MSLRRTLVAVGILAVTAIAAAPAAAQDQSSWSCVAGADTSTEIVLNQQDSDGESWVLAVLNDRPDRDEPQTNYLMVECVEPLSAGVCVEVSGHTRRCIEVSGQTMCIEGHLQWETGVDDKVRLVTKDRTKLQVRKQPCPVPMDHTYPFKLDAKLFIYDGLLYPLLGSPECSRVQATMLLGSEEGTTEGEIGGCPST